MLRVIVSNLRIGIVAGIAAELRFGAWAPVNSLGVPMFVLCAVRIGRTPSGPSTRLHSEDVLAIACDAAVDQGERDGLTVVNLAQREGSAIWVVSTATIGAHA